MEKASIRYSEAFKRQVVGELERGRHSGMDPDEFKKRTL